MEQVEDGEPHDPIGYARSSDGMEVGATILIEGHQLAVEQHRAEISQPDEVGNPTGQISPMP